MSDNNNLIKLWGNDDKRKKFAEAYRDWDAWFTTPELGWTWYRYKMPDETVIVAMEYEVETYAGYSRGYKLETTVCYYIWNKGKPFTPNCNSSIWAVADLLKKAKLALTNEAKTRQA